MARTTVLLAAIVIVVASGLSGCIEGAGGPIAADASTSPTPAG